MTTPSVEGIIVELHPVFDTLFRLSRMHEQNKLTIEPPEMQSNTYFEYFVELILFILNFILNKFYKKWTAKLRKIIGKLKKHSC